MVMSFGVRFLRYWKNSSSTVGGSVFLRYSMSAKADTSFAKNTETGVYLDSDVLCKFVWELLHIKKWKVVSLFLPVK